MEFTTHVEHVRREGELLAAAARAGAGTEPVPGCPGWDLDDLVRHTATVHRWATEALDRAGAAPDKGFFTKTEESAPRDHITLVSWYDEAHGRLVDRLTTIDLDAPTWTFLPNPVGPAFWGRRQAHETAIHRFDAEAAVGQLTGVGKDLAHDGVDEVLGFIAARGKKLLAAEPVTMGVRAVDTAGHWVIRIGPSERELIEPAGVTPDAAVSGLAADLYLYLWNRLDGLDTAGDPEVLALWRERAKIT